MKKQPKLGTMTVIPPQKGRRKREDDRQGVGIIEEAIGAVQGGLAAARRIHEVYRKIRGKK